MSSKPLSILFICMGNICRSPAAEAVFLCHAEKLRLKHRFEVDAAGTGNWHAGNPADPRSMMEGEKRGYSLITKARQVRETDLEHFDWFICMDQNNRQELRAMGAPAQKIKLLSDWHPDESVVEIPDPYYGGDWGFGAMYDLIEISVEGLIEDLIRR